MGAGAPDGFDLLVHKVRGVLGLDLASYRPEQVRRRLEGVCQRAGLGFAGLAIRLERDAALRAAVAEALTIHVSEFFRNPGEFERLAREVLPLFPRRGLRIWSAGCSIGAEPYSLAMVVREAGWPPATIWATDVDPGVLERVRSGRYEARELAGVGGGRLARHFVRLADGAYRVRPELLAMVRAERHDLLRDPFPGGWDLIVCRNVAIYFTEPAQAALHRRFAEALAPGGVLFVGATETVRDAPALGLEPLAPFFYRRRGAAA